MRHVYFSFHYADVWKVNQIRNSSVVFGARSAGFADRSLWEEAKAKNATALRRLIDDGLDGTSVTAVLIGRQTASRPWVKYELKESVRRGNALLGIHINKVPDRHRKTARAGTIPAILNDQAAPIYNWQDAKALGEWVEKAWRDNNPEPGLLAKLGRALGFY
jgi:hypothetical protein